MPSQPWPLVGRDAELARVAAALAASRAVGVVLAGPGGVGKSRLARECASLAEQAGYRVARALATRSASQIPLGALATVLTAHDGTPADLAGARKTLTALADEQPLLLIVDDAHLLDEVSAVVVLSAASDPRVFPLLTVRTGEPGPDAVTALWKDAGATRVDVEPLGAEAVDALLTRVLDGPVSNEAVQRLTHLSAGSPLALSELVESARGDQLLAVADGRWVLAGDPKVPARLAELIGARLDRIGPRAAELVATLALTEPLPVSTVDRIGLIAELEALESDRIASITDAGGVQAAQSVVTGRGTVYLGLTARLDHPLYGEVALERTGELQRRRMLARCAEALDVDHGSDHDALRSVLWRLWAGEELDHGSLLDAARRSYRVGDYARTRELAGAAWQSSPTFDAGHLLGFALGRTSESGRADQVLAATADLVADDRELALVTITRSEVMLRGLGEPLGAADLCEAAEAKLSNPAWRAEVAAHRAMVLVQRGMLSDALALLAPILEADEPAPRTLAKAGYAGGIALVHSGRSEEATALATRALPVHESLWSDDFFQTEPGVHHLTTLFSMIGAGRYLEVAPLLAMGLDLTRDALPRYGHAWISFLAGMAAVHQGLVDDALGHFATAAPIFHSGDQPVTERWCRAGSALAAAMRGEVATATEQLLEADRLRIPGLDLNRAWVAEARGWLHMARGDLDGAFGLLDSEADVAVRQGDLLGASRLLHSLARAGAANLAVERLEALAERTDGPMVRLQARHARLLARRDGSALGAENDQLAEELAGLGAFLHAAEASAEASRAHRRGGDQRAGAAAAARSREHLDRCQGARSSLTLVVETQEPLTAREREVARLAMDRFSSKEIADRLDLSPRTVDNHLQRAYRKLGVSSRADLSVALGDDRG